MSTRAGMRYIRIQTKLLLSYSGLLLTLTLVGNGFVYFLVRGAVQQSIENELATSTATIASMVRTSAEVSVRNRLRAIAEKNRDTAQFFHDQARAGLMTEQEAQAITQELFLGQSIGDTGYTYCLDSNGVLAVHPKAPLVGQNISEFAFIREQLARREGYLEYDWKNPDDIAQRPKALYMTYFEPWDWIVSASSYRNEFTRLVSVEDFRDSILSVKFGQTGYPYVLDSAGNVVIHPNLTGNLYDTEDSDGRLFIRDICEQKTGRTVYTWKNPGDESHRRKLAIFSYLPEYDWIVVSASYYDEFFAPLDSVRTIFVVTTLIALLLLVPLTIVVSSSITRPLTELTRKLQRAADGDLSVRVESRSRDEVGRLAAYFNGFMDRLEEAATERQLAEARRERAEERLRQSEKMRAVGQLAGGVAHDFNNMLAAIMGHAELLQLGKLSEVQSKAVRSILRAASRASSLTRSLLDFSRKSTIRKEVIDPNALLDEVVKLLEHTVDKRIRIETHLGAENATVQADQSSLQHALLNLALNARDAMPEGGVLRFETSLCTGRDLPTLEAVDEDAPYLRISVVDTGEGMDAPTLARVFEPFFTTKEQGKGTGLGLSSVYGCVQGHDGDIAITSEVGEGTRVGLYLPLHGLDGEVDSLPTSAAPPRGTGHVLLVEDEDTVRDFAAAVLEELGYSVTCCRDGAEAVEWFTDEHARVSLVLLDLVMPVMDGREAFQRLREIDPTVRILLCSGFTERGGVGGPLPPDAAGFLPKPFTVSELSRAVAGALEQAPQADPGAESPT